MSRHVTYEEELSFEDHEEESDDRVDDQENLYLMGSLMNLLKKSKHRRKLRQPSSTSDFYEHEILDEDDANIMEEKERLARERQYIHDEQKHIHKIHKELCDINNKLQGENKRLKEWEVKLQKKEKILVKAEKEISSCTLSMEDVIKKELHTQQERLEKEFESKLKNFDSDSKKLRASFKIIKKSNETLKAQLEERVKKIEKYEQKQTNLQNRISNLQRKNEILNQQLKEQSNISPTFQTSKEKMVESDKKISQKLESLTVPFYEVFGSTLQWISDAYLKQHITNLLKSIKTEHDVTTEIINDKCLKVMISLPNILPQVGQLNENIQLNFVQFIYWSLFHASLSQASQKFSHSATYRRIGEELFQSQKFSHSANYRRIGEELFQSQVRSKDKYGSFFRSQEIHTRVLSSLIILYTITQADILSQTFQALNHDLRSEQCKSCFVKYKASFVLLPLFKLTNKINLVNTLDILMIMSTESPYLQTFLESLSTVEWIQAILTVMRSCREEVKLMEKLSLLFQRLSKLKINKSILEALKVKSIVSEFIRSTNPQEEFLQLNLRSILFNLDSMKMTTHK